MCGLSQRLDHIELKPRASEAASELVARVREADEDRIGAPLDLGDVGLPASALELGARLVWPEVSAF